MDAARPIRYESNLLSRKEAAAYLGVSEQTLAIWRSTGRYKLPVVKIGRLAKYRKSDLDDFIRRRTF
jgi:excisionase family DNA binding protein